MQRWSYRPPTLPCSRCCGSSWTWLRSRASAAKALANGDQQPTAEPAGAAAVRTVATWAWAPIAAMLVTFAALIIVSLV